MAKGISVHIGVNLLDRVNFYKNTTLKDLKSCVNDAVEMKKLAARKGFQPKDVLQNPKKAAVKELIKNIAKNELDEGDIFLITFSGHGGQIKDRNRDERFDRFLLDETWCLFDKPMSDDEILDLWTDFKEGVRVLIISDSCHSGGMIDVFRLGLNNSIRSALFSRGFDFESFEHQLLHENGLNLETPANSASNKNLQILKELKLLGKVKKGFSDNKKNITGQLVKKIPNKILEQLCFVENRSVFENDQKIARENLIRKLETTSANHVQELKKASVISISACEDWQKTLDGVSETDNSDFTKALLSLFNGPAPEFSGNYIELRTALFNKLQSMQREQIPVCFQTGKPNDRFMSEPAFTIESSV